MLKYLRGTFLLNRELSDWAEGGSLPSWSKKQLEFSLQTYPCVSFQQFSMIETTFWQKTDNFAYFLNLYFQREYRRHFSHVYIAVKFWSQLILKLY